MIFKIDGQEYDLDSLSEDAAGFANRMTELQQEHDGLEVRRNEVMVLLNTYAEAIKKIANPEPEIKIVQ